MSVLMIQIMYIQWQWQFLINMNKILKRNTTDEDNPRYIVGEFKIVPNKIGLINVIDFKLKDK